MHNNNGTVQGPMTYRGKGTHSGGLGQDELRNACD